jgi:Dolichyl-phosphate-mannose-protein mannosyltransferase
MTRVDRVALGGALVVPWLFIWQGLDFTDQGYLLTGYRCFFRHVEATEDSGVFWLTNLLGATWNALFGGLGLVSMRALWALCMSLGMLLAFRWLRGLTSERAAAFAVLVASVFLSDRRETWFSYNTSSSLLFVAAAVSTARGVSSRQPRWLFAAGAWIGVVPFARLPNLLAAALLAAPVLAALLESERRARLVRELGVMVLGAVAGVLGMLALIFARGDGALYVGAIRGLFAPTVQAAGYAVDSLFLTFLTDEARALAHGFGICVTGFALSRVLGKVPAVASWLLVAVAAAVGIWGLTGAGEPWAVAVPGTVYFVLSGVTLGLWRRSVEMRVAAFITLIIVVIAPLGSNNGILNAHVGLWLGVPVLLALLGSLEAPWLAGQGAKLSLIAGLALTGEGLHQAATYTYRDSPRSELLTPVGHPRLRAQYTTPARAKVVAEVLEALDQRVKPGDYLLAYEGAPLLQYLTKTRPYLNRPWLMSYESPEVIARLAAEAPARTGCLPVVVATLKSTRGTDWPQRASRLEAKEPMRGTRRVIKGFLREHGYERTWKNSFFEILEPPAPRGGSCR